MDLPVFRRGLELVSAQLNKLSNAIRASTITSVIGGSLSCTPGGTTLVIDRQPATPGSTVACPFSASNVSDGTDLKIQIQTGTVLTPDGARYPDGMSIDGPPFYLNILGSRFIYCKISYIENTVTVVVESTGITLLQSDEILPNTVNDEYILLATVFVELEIIKNITNICLPVAANPCNLNWE